MDHMKPKHSAGQVKRLARAYHRKFYHSIGASLSVEDLEQELWIVWHRVSQKFDPSKGVEFAALLGVAARNRVLGLASFHHKRHAVIGRSLNDTVNTEDGSELLDLIADEDAEDAETCIANRQHSEWLLERMDPRLRKMVEILRDQPEEFLQEVDALRAKADRAAELGIRVQLPRRVTLGMLTELFGLSRCTRYRLLEEFKEIAGNV